MDILTLNNGSFGVSPMGSFKYEMAEDGSLLVWGKSRQGIAQISTWRGQFVEVIDAEGNVIHTGGDGAWFCVAVPTRRKDAILLRHKILPDPNLSPTALNEKRKTVTRYVFGGTPYSVDVPESLVDLIKWMQTKLEEIPKACRRSAELRFDTVMEYGETYPNIELTYEESETDDEVIRRVQVETERARLAEVAERAKLSQLQKKYAE